MAFNTTFMARYRYALDVKTGKVEGKRAKRNTSMEFIAFLNQVLSKARWAKEIHILLDNLSAHKTKAVKDFLGAASESALPLHADLLVVVEP